MNITNLSMEVVHPFKNPSTNYVTTFLSVDKLYDLASTQTPTYTCIPLVSNKMYILSLTTPATGSVACWRIAVHILTHSYGTPYLSNRLLPNMEQFAFKHRLRHPCLPRLWYKNCNESYNNVIKRDTNWVIQRFPDLVTKLYELEQDQTCDVKGVLFDKGKYVLSKQAAVLKVSYETWTQLLPEQRPRRLLKFVNFKDKASSTLTSTGGHLTIPHVTRVAQKPGKRKRTKNCKTVTAPIKEFKFSFKSSKENKL